MVDREVSENAFARCQSHGPPARLIVKECCDATRECDRVVDGESEARVTVFDRVPSAFPELAMDPAKVNPNGGAVALGHPIGATGSILTVKAMYELHRTGGRYALITMCIGGGQGIAAIIERM